MSTVEFKFSVGQRVYVLGSTEVSGVIDMAAIDSKRGDNKTYWVKWINKEGAKSEMWINEDELQAA